MRHRAFPLAFAWIASLCWGQMGAPGGGDTQAIALHPTDPSILYVGAARGLCKTTRGGKDNWPSSGLETLSPRAIVLDPKDPSVLYAGTYETGVYKSSDGGGSWHAVSDGIAKRIGSRKRGITSRANSSMLRMAFSCASLPNQLKMIKCSRPPSLFSQSILSATESGVPNMPSLS